MQSSLAAAPEKQETEDQEKIIGFLNRGDPPYERILLKYHKERVLSMLKGELIPPQEVEIQPSSACNLDCRHCFGKTLTCRKLPNKMGKKEIKRIAEQINNFKENGFSIESVKFCGTTGEPLVNPSMLYGIDLFRDLGKQIVVFTNGLNLDKKNEHKQYLDYMLKVNRLNLSLDAGSEQTFINLKGKQGFQRIINSLEALVQKKEKTLKINVSYVIGKQNYHEIIKAAEIIRNTGAEELRFRVDFTKPEEIHKLSDKIIADLNEAKKYSNSTFTVLSPYSDKEIREDDSAFVSCGRKCFTQNQWACIGPDCNLYACGHRTYFGVESYGSLLEHTFRELWISKKRIENLQNLPDDKCEFCSPFSMRANDLITFLSEAKKRYSISKIDELLENAIKNAN